MYLDTREPNFYPRPRLLRSLESVDFSSLTSAEQRGLNGD